MAKRNWYGLLSGAPSAALAAWPSATSNSWARGSGWLGVKLEDLADKDRFDDRGKMLPGVRVMDFPSRPPSPAKAAGLKEGDVIVEFQHHPVMNSIELTGLIGDTGIGSTAQLAVLRQSQRLEFQVVIGRRETN